MLTPKTAIGPLPIAMAACAVLTAAQAADSSSAVDTGITIYSTAQPGGVPPELYRPVMGQGSVMGQAVPGYAVVRQDRKIDLRSGRNALRFTDVAALIDPTTVQFVSLTDPDNTRVLEQNFQFDLVSTEKLLSKYVDKDIIATLPMGNESRAIAGTLLSSADGLVLRARDGQIHALRNYSEVQFGELPGGLITQPTLLWDISAKSGGTHTARVSYQTAGVTWWADYNLLFTPGANANAGFVDVGAWVSIINQSGASYDAARLKLIAGDVQRAAPPAREMDMMLAAPRAMAKGEAGFAEKSFFEYHLYTLGRRSSLPNNSTKQIELFDAAKRVPAHKTMVYFGQAGQYFGYDGVLTDRDYGSSSNGKVDVYLEFKNDGKVGLGVPLPKGRIRVSQLDAADQSLEFIGEDVIDHTPKDERVLVKLGSAFDVIGERKQIDFAIDSKARWMEEEVEVKVRNHKSEPVEVLVKENLFRWTNWRITKSTHEYDKNDAHTVYFPLKIQKDSEQVLHYRVHYSW